MQQGNGLTGIPPAAAHDMGIAFPQSEAKAKLGVQ